MPQDEALFTLEITVKKIAQSGPVAEEDAIIVRSANLSQQEVIDMREELLPILANFNKKDVPTV